MSDNDFLAQKRDEESVVESPAVETPAAPEDETQSESVVEIAEVETPEIVEAAETAPEQSLAVIPPVVPVVESPAADEVTTPAPAAPIEEEASAPEIPVASALTEDELLKKIAKLEKEIAELAESASQSDQLMEAKGDELEERIRVQEEFTDWVTKRRASYAWQLLNRLKAHEKDLALDEKLIRDFSEATPVIPEGFSESTRKWFMKRFWLNFSISWGAVILLLLVNRFSDQLSTWMADLFGGRSFLKMGLNYFLEQAIGLSLGQVIGTIFGFSLITFIGHLFAYSRRNSEYQQLVAEESSRTLAIEQGIDSVKAARERIDSLHPQVPQILDVLAIGLHQPWLINNESLMFNGTVPDTSKLPSCVEVAVPTIATKSPKYEELVNKAMNEIQIPGWRSDAYEKVMQKFAESIGFGSNGMAVRELEEDHRKTGKRQLIATASKNPEPATVIGEELVEHYTKIVQEKVLPFAQPQVVSLRPDPLDGLQLDGSLTISSNTHAVNWQEKLAEIADLASPWSIASFSSSGTANNRHEYVESIFIASDRVPSREGVDKETAVNPGARPFEVSIRVDLSQWCKPDEVAIFSDFQPTQEQLARWSRGGSTHGGKIVIAKEEKQIEPGQENLVV